MVREDQCTAENEKKKYPEKVVPYVKTKSVL